MLLKTEQFLMKIYEVRFSHVAFIFISVVLSFWLLSHDFAVIRPDIGHDHLTTLLEGASRASDALWQDCVFR